MVSKSMQQPVSLLVSPPPHLKIFADSTNIVVRTIRRALNDAQQVYTKNNVSTWQQLEPYLSEMKHKIADIIASKGSQDMGLIGPQQIQEDKDNAILAEVDAMMHDTFGIDSATELFQSLGEAFNQSQRIQELRAKFREKSTELIAPSRSFQILEDSRVPLYPYIGYGKVLIHNIRQLYTDNDTILKQELSGIIRDINYGLETIQHEFISPLMRGFSYDDESQLARSVLTLCEEAIAKLQKTKGITDVQITSIKNAIAGLKQDINTPHVLQRLESVYDPRGGSYYRKGAKQDTNTEDEELGAENDPFPL